MGGPDNVVLVVLAIAICHVSVLFVRRRDVLVVLASMVMLC